MLAHQNLCPNCYEAITNPICDDCLIDHFKYWLGDIQLDGKTKIKVLKSVRKSLRVETSNMDVCVACNREAPGLCPYCFSLKASSKLRMLNIPKESIEDFEYLFSDKFYTIQEEDGIEIKQ